MELQLQIVRDPCKEIDKASHHTFSERGGALGRAPDNEWVLPDPHLYVSGRHCEFEFHGGGFWVRDLSRNGVYVNDSRERIGYGRQVMLHDGDRVKLGLYEISVALRDPGALRNASDPLHHEAHQRTVAMPSAAHVVDHSDRGNAVAERVATDRADPLSDHSPRVETAAKTEATPTRATPTLAIDLHELRRRGLLPPSQQERLIANQFRQIKRSLLANAFGKGAVVAVANGRSIMVTSSLAGEGKTFSAFNLALSMAREQDVEVLLVDADVARPHATKMLELELTPGLLEALQDEGIDVESLVRATDIRGLSVLPAGRCDDDIATELLASARMEEIVARLTSKKPNRIVLFDSAPILLTNESRVLATIVGQVVIVVRAGATPQEAVKEAIEFVAEGTSLGLILNQVKASTPGSYYGYGSYGYGEYGRDDTSTGKTG